MATAEQPKHRPFVHLHLHSQYSLLDGAIRIPDLIQRCQELNQPAVAVTDHGVMFGGVQLMNAAKDSGVKPIIGCEIYLLPEGDHKDKTTKVKPNHLTLLVKNETGYRNLIKMVSLAFIEGFYYKPRINMEILEEHAEGLICLSGCLNGVVSQNILNNRLDKAEAFARKCAEVFDDGCFFIELQNHGLEEQKKIIEPMWDLAQRLGLPTVATNDSHYVYAEDSEAHDALLCIGTGKIVKDENRLKYTSDQFYVKSGDEMAEVFGGKYEEALDNTLKIAEMCDFEITFDSYKLPDYQVPEGHTIDSYFEKIARDGLEEKMPGIRENIKNGVVKTDEKTYYERLDTEINIIRTMGFSGYFLIVWDFINWSKQNNIPVGPGRGSGAGSLVAYTMGITGLDPIQYNLLFERFLNPERISMPDFDIDFCMRRRGEVIDYTTRKYGQENVSQIITFGTLKAKNAVRDVGRVLDVPYADVDKIAKMIPADLGTTLDSALKDSPDLNEAYKNNIETKKIIDIAKRLEGLTRHASTHAAGVVIAPDAMDTFCPLYKSSKDEITTQFDMSDVESIGLVKMDFLGLRTLTVIQDTVDAIKKDLDIEIDVESLPMGDKKAYELLSAGTTCGVFQFESKGMRDLLMRYQPERLEDLSALNALYRPGPIKGGLVDDFVERKHGRAKVEYIHPLIEEITEETYGVILYQEQVMQIASVIAGFSLGGADILRRAMGKKKKKLMEEQKILFLEGAKERGITKADAENIFDFIDKFSGYGFNKSHSTAYGLIAYQTAYLKAHYPAYFMAALLSNEMGDSDRVKLYISECADLNIDVLPPDVNSGDVHFVVEDKMIRFSLAAVKNVGVGAVEAIVNARNEDGNFKSLFDFCERVDLKAMNKRAIESLIKAGSFDSLWPNRAEVLATLDKAYEAGQKAHKDRESGQESLFGSFGGDEVESSQESMATTKAWSESEKLSYEKEILGFYFSGHPLTQFAAQLETLHTVKVEDLAERKGKVSVAGIITELRKRQTRKGQLMAAFVLEDDTGTVETVAFPDLYQEVYEDVIEDTVVVVEASIRRDGDQVKLTASGLQQLNKHKALEEKFLTLNLDLNKLQPLQLKEIVEIIKASPGETPMVFRIMKPGSFDVDLKARNFEVQASSTTVTRLQELVGRSNVIINVRKNNFSIS